jgi:putative ABC transport system permease protein
MLRESRGSRGRLAFFMGCIAVGVAAVVGVASMGATLEDGLRGKAREMLSADLVVQSRRPIGDDVAVIAKEGGAVETASARQLATMVAPVDGAGNVGKSRLVLLKAVAGRYPFYGPLVLDPPGPLHEALQRGVVVAPELLENPGVQVGEKLRVGGKLFPVVAVVREEPQQFGFAAMLGPRVFVAEAGLKDTGLLGFGSRVQYQLLARLPGSDAQSVRELSKRLREEPKGAEYLRVESWRSGQPRVRRAIARVERYLGLVALLSLVLGGIGVAQIVRAWIESRTESIAILRCIGMRPREILTLFLGQIGVLALVGSLVGALCGSLLPLALSGVADDLLGPGLAAGPLLQPMAIARGLGLGLAIALLFSLPPLTAVWRVSPARVLRAEAEPLPAPPLVRYGALVALLAGIWGTAWAQSTSLMLATVFTVGFIALCAALVGGAWVVMSGVARLPRARMHPYIAQGLTALARPGAGTTGGIVALGLGVMVVATMAIVERELSSGIRTLIPEDAPTIFLVDVQPDQWEGVKGELESHGADPIQSAAIVMARLRSINGRSVAELSKDRGGGGRARWTLTREQRMAPLETLPADNKIVEGELWSDPGAWEVSMETRYAADMGAELGDRLVFDVLGVPLEFKLTSLRKVEWRSFSLNFFLAVEPGALDGVPNFRLAAAKLDEEREQPLQDKLATGYPNITMIRVRPILDQAVGLLEKLAVGVRALGGFTVLAGLAILAGAISAATVRRRREAALLKTLGATRGGVGVLFVTEYGLLGAVAGLLGSSGAVLLAWGFLQGVADLEFAPPLWTIPFAALLAGVLAAACGILASWRALTAKPVESLRV